MPLTTPLIRSKWAFSLRMQMQKNHCNNWKADKNSTTCHFVNIYRCISFACIWCISFKASYNFDVNNNLLVAILEALECGLQIRLWMCKSHFPMAVHLRIRLVEVSMPRACKISHHLNWMAWGFSFVVTNVLLILHECITHFTSNSHTHASATSSSKIIIYEN